eukprot:1037199_1
MATSTTLKIEDRALKTRNLRRFSLLVDGYVDGATPNDVVQTIFFHFSHYDNYLSRRRALASNLFSRPSKAKIVELGYLNDSMAPSLQPIALRLHTALKKRPLKEALLLKGIMHMPIILPQPLLMHHLKGASKYEFSSDLRPLPLSNYISRMPTQRNTNSDVQTYKFSDFVKMKLLH